MVIWQADLHWAFIVNVSPWTMFHTCLDLDVVKPRMLCQLRNFSTELKINVLTYHLVSALRFLHLRSGYTILRPFGARRKLSRYVIKLDCTAMGTLF